MRIGFLDIFTNNSKVKMMIEKKLGVNIEIG